MEYLKEVSKAMEELDLKLDIEGGTKETKGLYHR